MHGGTTDLEYVMERRRCIGPKEVFKSNAVIVEGDFIEDGILVASSEGSKISSRRKWFEKEDPAIMGGMDGGRAVKETDWATKGAEEMAISDGADAPVHG